MNRKQIRHLLEYTSPVYFFKRSRQFINVSEFKLVFYLIDYYLMMFRYGATIDDYFTDGFWNSRHSLRKQHVTLLKAHKIWAKLNSREAAKVFNKTRFNYFFKEFRSIDWVDCKRKDITFEQFREWIDGKDYVMLKDPADTCGRGVIKLELKNFSTEELYRKYFPSRYLFEDVFVQDGLLSEINPHSLNTIRVYTINVSGEGPEIPYAILRMGNGYDYRDNAHAGGLFAEIDVNSGVIISQATNYENHEYPFHPFSKVKIIGQKIPRWEDVKKTVIDAATLVPEIRYCGWDVAVSSNGITLIEGNENGDFMIYEVAAKTGLWPFYIKILKKNKFN